MAKKKAAPAAAKKKQLGSSGVKARKQADERMKRSERVADMYLRGKSLSEIAKETSKDRRTVQRDLELARQCWRERAAATYEAHLAEQIAKIDATENAAWDAFERSQAEYQETQVTTGETKDGPIATTKNTRRRRDGSAAYLAVIAGLIKQRCELLGLLDKTARESIADEEDVVSIVIESREEANELKSLSFDEYKKRLASAAS